MDQRTLLLIFSLAFTGLTSGAGVLPDGPLTAAVGGTVMFNVSPVEGTITAAFWEFAGERIINLENGENTTSPGYEGRITFFPSTASLELRNVSLSDSGEYRVTISAGGGLPTGTVTLDVYEPVSNVAVSVSGTDLLESDSVRFSCSVSTGSPQLVFLWMNSSSEVTASDRVQITAGGSNLTITNVTRDDEGTYKCTVSNPVSSETSTEVNLIVSYGPENTVLQISPSQDNYEAGAEITLSCSADSRPEAQFRWFVNEAELLNTGSELRLTNLQIDDSGNYSCMASNSRTSKNETSEPVSVSVTGIEPVSNVAVSVSGTDLLESDSVHFSCSASTGSSLVFLWMNSSSEVTASDRVQITAGGSNLTITNVMRYDEGTYKCTVSNPVSSESSTGVNLIVSYGPESTVLQISPSQEHYEAGAEITLSCSADSRPEAQFRWFVNETELLNTGSELRLTDLQIDDSGSYSCMASNSRTSKNETSAPVTVTVIETESRSSCSAGCIAGIVIACLVVCGGAAAGGYFVYKKKKSRSSSKRRDVGEGRNNSTFSEDGEVKYADVAAFRKNDGGVVQLGSQNETENAQVRGSNNPARTSSPPTYDDHMQRGSNPASQPCANGSHYAQIRKK